MINKIAVLTSGGDSPGMNAAIRAVVRSSKYHKKFCVGIFRGYQGLIDNDIEYMDPRSVSKILGKGGTILKSARCKEFRTKEGRQKAFDNLVANDIDALVAIGGDGTFTGAQLLHEEHGFPVVGVPGTIDNDLFGTDYTLGYDTAMNTVIEAVDKIRDTASSHNRLFFVEVMGRDSGFIALNAGLATGCIEVMLPETEIHVDDLIATLEKGRKNKKTSSIVMVAEGNQNGDAMELAKQVKERYDYYDTRVTVLGHIQRGGSPTAFDRILASELGVAAVEALLNGKSDIMVGWEKDAVSYIPFKEAIHAKKHVSAERIRINRMLSS